MKIILTTMLLAAMAFTLEAREIKFKDGTVLNAQVRRDGAWAPNHVGIVLNVANQVYIHHYPATPQAIAPPVMNGDIVPARIAFQHFTRETLRQLHAKFSTEKAVWTQDALRGIASVFHAPANRFAAAHHLQTARWQNSVENRIGHWFKTGRVVWGRLAAMPPVPANTAFLNQQVGTFPTARPPRPQLHPVTGLPIAQEENPPYPAPPAARTMTAMFPVNAQAIQQLLPVPQPGIPTPMYPYHYDNCLPGRMTFMMPQSNGHYTQYWQR